MILIIGDGILGSALARAASVRAPGSFVQVSRKMTPGFDLTDAGSIDSVIEEHHPVVVVNAAAYTDVDGAEQNHDSADLVNGLGPRLLANACRIVDAALVHVSTDMVFNRCVPRQPGGFKEEDLDDMLLELSPPAGAYARSKLEGERAVRQHLPLTSLIVRASWIIGPWGGWLPWAVKAAEAGRKVTLLRQRGRPTWSHDLANFIMAWAVQRLLDEDHNMNGYINWANTGECRKAELFDAVWRVVRNGEASGVVEGDVEATGKAGRSLDCTLDTTLAEALAGKPPHWAWRLEEEVRAAQQAGWDQASSSPRGPASTRADESG